MPTAWSSTTSCRSTPSTRSRVAVSDIDARRLGRAGEGSSRDAVRTSFTPEGPERGHESRRWRGGHHHTSKRDLTHIAQAWSSTTSCRSTTFVDLVRLTGGDLDGENRTRIMVCITMDSHGRDIVQKLIREKVSDATEFQWQSQLKHKYRETPSTAGMMCFPTRDPHLRDPPGRIRKRV